MGVFFSKQHGTFSRWSSENFSIHSRIFCNIVWWYKSLSYHRSITLHLKSDCMFRSSIFLKIWTWLFLRVFHKPLREEFIKPIINFLSPAHWRYFSFVFFIHMFSHMLFVLLIYSLFKGLHWVKKKTPSNMNSLYRKLAIIRGIFLLLQASFFSFLKKSLKYERLL